jgi:Lipoprotein amino terminal region
MKQTALLAVSDLLSAACESPFYKEKRFSVQYLGDLCTSKDAIIVNEFLPILAEELQRNETKSSADYMAALTAIGSLGIEEILPILEPHVKGTGEWDDTAERTRAIYSLHRVMYSNPEKVLPWLMPLADNVAERPEVRMAAISMILTANSPFVYWQRLATRTWFEPSVQVQSFTYNMIESFTKITPISPFHLEM